MTPENLQEILKVLSQELRFRIVKLLVEEGPHPFSDMVHKLGLSYNSKLSFHLNKLKEAGLVRMEAGGLYNVTDLGRIVYDKLQEIGMSIKLKYPNIAVLDKQGVVRLFSKETLSKGILKRSLLGQHAFEVASEVESTLLNSGLTVLEEEQFWSLINAALIRRGVKPPIDLSFCLTRCSEIARIATSKDVSDGREEIFRSMLNAYYIRFKFPGPLKDNLLEGHVAVWNPSYTFMGAAALFYKDPTLLAFQKGSSGPLKLASVLLSTSHVVGEQVVDDFGYLACQMGLNNEKEASKFYELLETAGGECRFTLRLKSPDMHEKLGVDEDLYRDAFCSLIDAFGYVHGRGIVLQVELVREDLSDQYLLGKLYHIISQGRPIMLKLSGQMDFILSGNLFRIERGNASSVEILSYAGGINLPVAYTRSLGRGLDIIGLLEDAIASLRLLERTRPMEGSRKLFSGLDIKGDCTTSVHGQISLLGLELALRMHHGHIDVNELMLINKRFWREIAERFEDDALIISSSINSPELYDQLMLIRDVREYSGKRFGDGISVQDFNVLGPYSYARDYDFSTRIRMESEHQRDLPSSSLFNLKIPFSSIGVGLFRDLLVKLIEAGLEWIVFSQDMGRCRVCDTTFTPTRPLCPSCFSSNVQELVCPLVCYVDVLDVPKTLLEEYRSRRTYGIAHISSF